MKLPQSETDSCPSCIIAGALAKQERLMCCQEKRVSTKRCGSERGYAGDLLVCRKAIGQNCLPLLMAAFTVRMRPGEYPVFQSQTGTGEVG